MIDKIRVKPSITVLHEYGLPIVYVLRANVDHPSQPEALVAANVFKTGSRQNLQYPSTIAADEARTKAQARIGSQGSSGRLLPDVRILVNKTICNQQRLPCWNSQSACSVELGPAALIKEQGGALKVVYELDHIKQSVTCLNQSDFRTPV